MQRKPEGKRHLSMYEFYYNRSYASRRFPSYILRIRTCLSIFHSFKKIEFYFKFNQCFLLNSLHDDLLFRVRFYSMLLDH